MEAIACIAPFAKTSFQLTLLGITNEESDPAVDVIRTTTLPLLRKFGVEDGLELKITKRGASPDGGGEVYFACPVVRALKPIRFETPGMIKRIRGIAYSMRVAATTANRVVDSSRGLLNKLLPDVFIFTDHYTGSDAGRSPGFGLVSIPFSHHSLLIFR